MAGMINIENTKTGERYAVLPRDFQRNKDGQYDGFKAGDYEDGTPYEAPAKHDAPKLLDKSQGEGL